MDTATSTVRAPDITRLDPAATHRHASSCYWDHRSCAWSCSHTASPLPSAPEPGRVDGQDHRDASSVAATEG
jgi:hypothetical protein